MSPSVPTTEPTDRRSGAAALALACLAMAMLLSSLGTSIANVALPTLAAAFHARFAAVQWIVLAYLLAVTTLVVTVGRLADLVGRRRLMIAGIAAFTVSSLACAAAPDLRLLVAGRVGQGLGAAVMMALSMALVGDAMPAERTGRAMGFLGTMSAVGTALGPSLGGALVGGFGWRAIFLVNVPLGLAAMVLAATALPLDPPRDRRPAFDLLGSVLLAATLAAYALSMTVGRGASGGAALPLLLAAAAGAGLFVVVESRSASPLVRPSLFRDRAVRDGFATSALVATVAMTTLVVGPFYLARSLALGPAAIGLVMTAGPLVAALAGVPAGRAVDRHGTAAVTVAGLGAMAAGCLALAVVPPSLGIVGYLLPLVATTAGYATFQAANNTAVVTGSEPGQRGVVSGLLNLSRNLGLVTGASVMGAVFALGSHAPEVATASPAAVAAGARTAFAVAAVLVVAALVVVAGSARRAMSAVSPALPALLPRPTAQRPASGSRLGP